ncbi:MAG TPA: hypothetical protein VMU87_06815, partial [Stellaceae bacterium]|nr:hypothetical protein [Stellaceae bacterium]
IAEGIELAFHKASADSMKFTDAEAAAANTYASVSAIPGVGWILAPAAAAGAFAAVMAFDTGSWSVPATMPAIVHAGEMIIPADMAASIRGGGGLGGSVTVNLGGISNIDARSVAQLFNSPTLLRSLAVNLGRYMASNPSTQGAF